MGEHGGQLDDHRGPVLEPSTRASPSTGPSTAAGGRGWRADPGTRYRTMRAGSRTER